MLAKQIELDVVKYLSAKLIKQKFFTSVCVAIFFMLFSVPTEATQSKFSQNDEIIISRVEKYLNELITLKSRFLQATSKGNYAEGTFYLSRPGKMRIEYDPPVKFLIVADGNWLIYNDLELNHITHLPINMSPASVLVEEKISLLSDKFTVTKVDQSSGVISVNIVPVDDDIGTLILIFADKPLELKKWIVIDAQGIKTSVSLLSSQRDIAIDPKLFKIKLKENFNPLGEK